MDELIEKLKEADLPKDLLIQAIEEIQIKKENRLPFKDEYVLGHDNALQSVAKLIYLVTKKD